MTVSATSGAAGFGALVLFLTVGAWTRRLGRLADASEAISRGDLESSIHDPRVDEIGQLARSLETMRLNLRQRDHEVRQFTETLQDQVKARTKDLELALGAAEEASRAKSLFLANMSHELRTPLNGVIGMVDLLLKTELNASQRRYCEVAKGSARSLVDLINDILDFSKIEAGKLELDSAEFDLHDTIGQVAQVVGQLAEKKKLELICTVANDVPRQVVGDPVRLRQVVPNLVSNAVKFTEKGEVVISAALVEQTGSHAVVKFSVRDTGIGIPADRLDRLFRSFSQVDASTTRKFGGTGLGLAISQRIVTLMGGQIGVESEVGKGATFWFTARLECRLAPQAGPGPTSVQPRDLRVLVLDDNHTTRQVLRTHLESWSMRADVTGDAEQALRLLNDAVTRNEPYKLAIIDSHMPAHDGLRLARHAKRQPALGGLILISLRSIIDPLQQQEMNNLGFAASLSKPVLPSQLFDLIVDVLAAGPGGQLPVHDREDELPTLPGVRVLLAEDNEVNRLVACELLGQAGCVCTTAVNGKEALEKALRGGVDLVLMDCQMPEMDGLEATRKLRAAEREAGDGRHVPVIALTANAIKGDREICLEAGMDDYVTKPIDPIELLATMRTFVPPAVLAECAAAQAKAQSVEQAARASSTNTNPPAPVAAATNTVQAPLAIAATASPAPDSAPPVADVPPVDLDSLTKRCMGNRRIAAKALGMFDQTLSRDLEALSQCLQTGDATAVAASAHKIKGAAANVSAEGIRELASRLEQLGKTDALSQTGDLLEQLNRQVSQFHGYLQTALAGLGPPRGK